MTANSSIFSKLKTATLGDNGGITRAEAVSMVRRNKFSDYLPWTSCDNGAFSTIDNRVGYIWEICPYTFQGQGETDAINGLFNIHFPRRTILQFVLYPDHNVDAHLEAFLANKTRPDPLTQRSVREYANHLRRGTHGMNAFQGIPVRNFRAFVALKPSEPISDQDLSIFEETLKGAKLAPVRWTGADLVAWGRQIFNDPYMPPNKSLDEEIPLRKQIIDASTTLDFSQSIFKIGNRFATVISPKICPKKIDTLLTNKLVGGYMGQTDDGNQITTPFIWSLNIVFEDLKSTIHSKANITMAQKAGGSFAKAIQKRTSEFSWALDKLEDGSKFVSMIPSMVIFGDDEQQCLESTSRAKRIWETHEFVMQQEAMLNKAMFISSLPLGLYDIDNNLTVLDRHFYVPSDTASAFLPIQGDFQGCSVPVLMYVGRKGQIQTIDVFDKRSNNYNFVVMAGSGAGKSFSLSHLLNSYYATGALVRCVDIGYSYEKLAYQAKGKFIDFGKERIVVNPFTSNAKDDEDRQVDAMATANTVAEMVYSASRQPMTETEWTLIKEAVRWAIENGEDVYGIDSVARYLKEYPKLAKEPPAFSGVVDIAQAMSYNLFDFTTKGPYGRFFNGPTTFNIKDDEFVVIELDRLTSQKELFNVVIFQMLNSVTQDLYLSDRSKRRFILFEETAQYFTDGSDTRIAASIEIGYRRARKYGGSFGTVIQSPLDFLKFGPVGRVIKSNAAYKFMLQSDDYEKAVDEKVLDYAGHALNILKGVKNNKPKYSEIFFETPLGRGVGRLAVDPWNYWINTSAPDEVSAFNTLVKSGVDPMNALIQLSGIK